eukprot:TRINITY_DN13879_c0_g1_i1.p1 TRINITY_DN13879_c0_g1~~TRINITY_DN13879_c0_g1_i1.p1  ORF type:complete len:563 (-),score=100.05 TRINITY_DN13879_c0_g1_i1:557-2245(-)
MKFAKQLQDELRQEWCDKYMDYKLMKKTLKREDPEAAQMFLGVLQSELAKVSGFMYGQKEVISKGTTPIELGITSSSSDAGVPKHLLHGADGNMHLELATHCTGLVDTIAAFRSYAALNHVAFRKIVKKFDKRFQVSCMQEADMRPPRPDDSWLSVSDINAWMLTPAERCLRIMQTATSAWPLAGRQLQFWTQELRAGCRYADARLKGSPEGALGSSLLSLRGQLRERNTFLEPCGVGSDEEDQEAALMLRRPRSYASLMTLSGARCDNEQASNHSRDASPEDDRFRCGSECLTDFSGEMPIHPELAAYNAAAAAAVVHPQDCVRMMMMMMGLSNGVSYPAVSAIHHKKYTQSGWGETDAANASGGSWWSQLTESCPLTGFPLCLLPYPPFKLRSGDGGRTKLVDGLHLALLVLTTWNFEVAGRTLTASDIDALDSYIKKCKHGPASFRIRRAMELKNSGTPAALKELEKVRSRARRRLQEVQHKQRVRKVRESDVVVACAAAADQKFSEELPRARGTGSASAGSKNGRHKISAAAASLSAPATSGACAPVAAGRVFAGMRA